MTYETETVRPEQRFTREHPCPICGGHRDEPPGMGARCWGYRSDDGLVAFCTREEQAGELELLSNEGYGHLLSGECGCGERHDRARQNGHNHSGQQNGTTTTHREIAGKQTYRITFPDGTLAGLHTRTDYHDQRSDGTILHGKTFTWTGHNGRRSVDMPLYGVAELGVPMEGSRVFVVEGEKACDVLRAHGMRAVGTVTGAGGAAPCDESLLPLCGWDEVVLWPDNDAVGQEHMRSITVQLLELGASRVRWVTWPAAPDKGDAADYFADGSRTRETLEQLIGRSPLDERGKRGNEFFTAFTAYGKPPTRPPLDGPLYHGVAGEMVRAIEPHTEADPLGILTQLLVAFGNMAGRHAYFLIEGEKHYVNLDVVLVGGSSRSRKGTSRAHALARCVAADPGWCEEHIQTGLSSGEGLIHTLRDPTLSDPIQDDELLRTDKRMLIIQSEFAWVLKMVAREGSVLGEVLREAWDGARLQTLTKHSPEHATQHHISLIGHITQDELLRNLTDTESANGFGNRIIWVHVQRARELPEGGDLDDVNFREMDKRLAEAVQWAQFHGKERPLLGARPDEQWRVCFDADALALWRRAYHRLTEGYPGLLGALTARAEAQVTRVALLYALLDCSEVIRKEHLEAAMALWDYCEQSVRFIFGDKLGDHEADVILSFLREVAPNGRTRDEIRERLGRNAKAGRIAAALGLLVRAGLARMEVVKTGEPGRPIEMWYALSLTTVPRADETERT